MLCKKFADCIEFFIFVHIINGNHEDLYDALRDGSADLIRNDQRRAFTIFAKMVDRSTNMVYS